MKSVFIALWCFCFMLIAVIGCDQGKNMMKPIVQDAMDTEQMDQPDTTVPEPQPDTTAPEPQPDTEGEQDNETMEPTVPDPDVEVPPVSVEDPPTDMEEEMPAEPSDPYTPLNGLVVSNGRISYLFFSAGQCIVLSGKINGVTYEIHYSEWQRREDATSPWVDIPGTNKSSGLCSYSPADPGQYRLICEISFNGIRRKHSSENILIVE